MSNTETPSAKPAAPAGKSSKPDPIISVNKRNRDLEKRMHRQSYAIMALAGVLAILAIIIGVLGTRQPIPVYFVQNSDGTGLARIIPLNQPNSSPGAVTQLVADGIGCINALDFANYKNQLAGCAQYFTKSGWGRFLTEFENSGARDAIEKRNLVLSSIVNKPPKITNEGEIMGALFWDGEAPYTVRYQGAGYDQTQTSVAVVKVVRVPITENPRGIAIAQIISKNGG